MSDAFAQRIVSTSGFTVRLPPMSGAALDVDELEGDRALRQHALG